MLYMSDQFYEEMKSAKVMADQVLVIDLPFGYSYVSNYPPPLNMENINIEDILCRCCIRIVPPNNSPHRRLHIILSDNPAPKTIDCYVYQDIYIAMDLNFFICLKLSGSGLVVIKVQEDNRYLEVWMRGPVGN